MNTVKKIEKPESFRLLVEDALLLLLDDSRKSHPLREACRYTFATGGKRIRPVIALSILDDLSIQPSEYLQAALSLELLHLASLIHDDLPALDNDTSRRGQNTCHVQFNEPTAILAADYLISRAFECLASLRAEPAVISAAIQTVSRAFCDLCNGQQLDVQRDPQSDQALISTLKTGSLFQAAFSLPFIFAGYSEEVVSTAGQTGIQVGVCYQVCDDLADLLNSSELKGRSVSSDLRNEKQLFRSHEDILAARGRINLAGEDIRRNLQILEKSLPNGNRLSVTRSTLRALFSKFVIIEVELLF